MVGLRRDFTTKDTKDTKSFPRGSTRLWRVGFGVPPKPIRETRVPPGVWGGFVCVPRRVVFRR